MSGGYLRVMCGAVPAIVLYEVVQRWLSAQGLVRVATWIIVIVTPLHIALTYLLVSSSLSFYGAPIAATITFNLMVGKME